MPLITETYYLSLTQDNRGILRLRCSQDDTLRTVNLKLYNNGSIFVIPSGISASISGVKQNGAVFSKPCTISQNRESVVLQLSSDITNVDGIIVAEIVLNDGEGGRLGTSNFIIQVEKNPIRAGIVQDTETPIEYINDFIEKIQTLTARLNNLITPSGDPSLAEVVDARIGILDSTTYQTLGARLNAEFQRLSNALNGTAILESTGDTTDRTSEILSKLNTYGVCKLGKGDFYVNSLVMPEDSQLIGSGKSTRIILPSSVTDGYVVKPKSNCIIENISFYGGFTGTHSELIASAATATRHCIILDRFNNISSENVILNNIFINNFVGSAIIQRYTTGCHCEDIIINMCYVGIDISNASYDGQCTNISMTNTRFGVVQNGSNFVFTNCVSKDSDQHILSDQQNTECTFSSCTFSDSSLETTSRLATLSNARNGFVFDNCIFDSGLKMLLNACDGIVIKGTNFVGSDTFRIIVSNGRNTLLLITDCIADVEPVVTNAGENAHIISCYLKDGTAWSISETQDGSGGSSTLAELTDTDISSEQDGQVLTYDGTSHKWVNRTPSDGSVEIEVDNELSSTSENPVQNKVINRKISEIKADLGNVKSTITNGYQSITTLVNGSFNANGNLTVRADRLREETFIHAESGDKIIVDAGSLKYAVGAWNGTPSTETNVRNDSTFRENGETIVSDFDGYYIIVFAKQNTSENITPSDFDGEIRVYSGEIYSNTQRIAETNAHIEEIKSDVSEIENALTVVTSPIYEDIPTAITVGDGYYGANGSYNSSTDYKHSQKISVIEGDIITPVSVVSSAYFRFICAYNGTSAVSSAGAGGKVSYTVPSGIDGVIVSWGNSKQITAVNIKRLTGEEKTVYPVAQELGYTNWKGSLSNGTNVKLLSSNVRFNVVWAFTGHVSTMGKVTIGITASDSTFKELCSVDATNIYYRQNNGNITSEAHGLTVSEDLQIRIESAFLVNELKKIVICSGGTKFSPIGKPYGTDMNGAPTLISDGATMTDCAFAWIPRDIDKPIWIFGDSWGSMYDARWVYYMTEAGYKDSWMLNAFAGEKTEQAYEALKNLLTIRKPEYIVWMLGMNNGDTNSAVNSTWKSVYDELLSICEAYKITPILYTVPNTPTINNNFKNDIVRNSGYRYIDGAAAVGDDGNGNWFTGFEQSASDHNHTSANGARALFMRILADFPEIASNSL